MNSADNSNDPNVGPWHLLQCRANSHLRLPLTDLNANGIVVAFDIYPYSDGAYPQTILSFRNSQNFAVPFTIELMNDLQVRAWRYDNPWQNVVSSGNIITNSSLRSVNSYDLTIKNIDAWNRVIVEVVQAQPSEFEVGYCSGRIWINGVNSSRIYFGNFTQGIYLFDDMNNVEITLCSRKLEGSDTDLLNFGEYDLMNFVWFKGSEGLYIPSNGKFYFMYGLCSFKFPTDPSCALAGFINPLQTACLQCNSGYYLVENKCLSSCPTGYLLHSDTNSCQSNFTAITSSTN